MRASRRFCLLLQVDTEAVICLFVVLRLVPGSRVLDRFRLFFIFDEQYLPKDVVSVFYCLVFVTRPEKKVAYREEVQQ